MRAYLRKNWGAPFVAVFVLLILISAVDLASSLKGLAETTSVYGFYALIVGVVLQAASSVKDHERRDALASETGIHRETRTRSRRKLLLSLAAITAASLLVAGLAFVFPGLSSLLSAGTNNVIGTGTPVVSRSGCTGGDGSIYISPNINSTVPLTICKQSFLVRGGPGGGLVYMYSAGTLTLTAPLTVDGRSFEFWYVILGDHSPKKVYSDTLALSLAPGLTSKSELIEPFYSPQNNQTVTTTIEKNQTVTSTFTSTVTSIVTTTLTTTSSCRGNDGVVYVSSNINATISLSICNETISVPSGLGGSLLYSYHAGPIELVAPTSVDGKTFQFWYVVLGSQPMKFTGNGLTLNLPAGLSSQSSLIEAFYG